MLRNQGLKWLDENERVAGKIVKQWGVFTRLRVLCIEEGIKWCFQECLLQSAERGKIVLVDIYQLLTKISY